MNACSGIRTWPKKPPPEKRQPDGLDGFSISPTEWAQQRTQDGAMQGSITSILLRAYQTVATILVAEKGRGKVPSGSDPSRESRLMRVVWWQRNIHTHSAPGTRLCRGGFHVESHDLFRSIGRSKDRTRQKNHMLQGSISAARPRLHGLGSVLRSFRIPVSAARLLTGVHFWSVFGSSSFHVDLVGRIYPAGILFAFSLTSLGQTHYFHPSF